MNEEHARRVAEIEALAADYTEPADDPLPFKVPPETIERLKGKWAADCWQRIANTFAVPVGYLATRPSMTATEVQAQIDEARQRLAPVAERVMMGVDLAQSGSDRTAVDRRIT